MVQDSIYSRSRFKFKTSRPGRVSRPLNGDRQVVAQQEGHDIHLQPGSSKNSDDVAIDSQHSSTDASGCNRCSFPSLFNGNSRVTKTSPSAPSATASYTDTLCGIRPAVAESLLPVSSSESGSYIISPLAAGKDSGACSLASRHNCIINLPATRQQSESVLSSLAIQDVTQSVIVCGTVEGPIHVSGVKSSVIQVKARQFRIHNSRDVDVYMSCASRPTLENSTNIRLAKLPNMTVHYFIIFPRSDAQIFEAR